MRSAYYSRNNSYSRSYNASVAESEERYPLTRCLKYIGISPKEGRRIIAECDIHPSEWHHVGKFANRVDYYDTCDFFTISALKSMLSGTLKSQNIAKEHIRKLWQRACDPKLYISRTKKISKFKFRIPNEKISEAIDDMKRMTVTNFKSKYDLSWSDIEAFELKNPFKH